MAELTHFYRLELSGGIGSTPDIRKYYSKEQDALNRVSEIEDDFVGPISLQNWKQVDSDKSFPRYYMSGLFRFKNWFLFREEFS